MKHNLFKAWLMLCLLTIGVGTAWAEEQTATLTFTAACGGSGTDDKSNSWTVTSDASESAYDGTKGIHYGTGSAAVSYLTLTNSSITGTITKIVVNASGASSTCAKIDVKVGGSAFGSQQSLTSSNAAYTFNGSASGNIEISLTQTSAKKALYVKSVAVTYTTAADTRTAVNMTGFSATSTTLIKGGNTATSVTNDQNGWTAAYTYESNNTSVATVSNDGVITAVAKGTATITASLNIANDDATWKKGATASKTIDITVNNPSHTAHFSVNGTIDPAKDASVEEGSAITFPSDPAVDDVVFKGWATAAIDGTQDNAPSFVNTATETMGTNDVTYYAVFATEEEGGTQWKLVSSLTNGKEYVFATKNVAGAAYALSSSVTTGTSVTIAESGTDKVISGEPANTIIWTAATGWSLTNNGVATNNKLTINGSTFAINGTGSSNLSWTTNYGLNGQSGSGSTKYYVQCTNTGTFSKSSTSGSTTNRVYAYEKSAGVTYSDYCTTVALDPKPTIVLSATELAEYAGNTNNIITVSVTEPAYTETLTVASSAEAVATASIVDGKVQIQALTAGTATITVTAPAMTGFRKNTATIAVTVNEKLAHGLAFDAATLNLTVGDTEITEPTLSNPNTLPVVYSLVYAKPENDGKVATINAETGKLTLAGLSTETQGDVTVKATTVGDNSHAAGEVTYNLVVARKVSTTTWSNSGAAVEIDQDEIVTLPTASNSADRNIQYESSSTDVATIDGTGAVTFVAYGTTTITAKTSATAEYAATSATYELTFAPRYTVTFNVNGNVTELREETSGAGVTAPAVEPIAGKVFRGWAEATIDGTTDDAPAFVSTSSLDEDKTLYAVFATQSGSSSTEDIDMTSTSVTKNGFTIACAKGSGATAPAYSSSECRLYASNTITISSEDYITALSLTFHKQGSKDYITTITANVGSYVSGGSSTSGDDEKVDTWTGSSKSVVLTAGSSGQRVFVSASVTTGSFTYSDYCTTVKGTISISSVGYTTYFTDAEFTMPEGLEGYVVTPEGEGVKLTCKFEAGATVPASTALLVKGEEGSYKYNITNTGATFSGQNYLHGNLTAGTIEAVEGASKYYKLLNGSKGLGWYLGDPEGGVFTLGANKAYLALPERFAAKAVSFLLDFADEDDADAIKAVKADSNDVIYNLSGQRINKMQKGINIVNGKKVLK